MSGEMAPWPRYEQDEIDAVTEVLRSGRVNYWTGTQGREFEREFAEFTGIQHAVFVANGTLALELALRALDLPAGSEVVTTPQTPSPQRPRSCLWGCGRCSRTSIPTPGTSPLRRSRAPFRRRPRQSLSSTWEFGPHACPRSKISARRGDSGLSRTAPRRTER